MKGVNAIIVVILLLMISTALASTAYFFLSETTSSITDVGTEMSGQMSSSLLSEMRIINITGNTVTVKNTGKTELSDFAVFVNGDMADAHFSHTSIASGGVLIITLDSDLNLGDIVKVVSAQDAFAIKTATAD